MRRYGIALAIAAMLVPLVSLAQSKPETAQGPEAAAEAAGRTEANATPTQRSLMGVVMGALIASAEQKARLEGQARRKPHASAPLVASEPRPDADHPVASEPAPMPQPRTSAVQQVAIGSEP